MMMTLLRVDTSLLFVIASVKRLVLSPLFTLSQTGPTPKGAMYSLQSSANLLSLINYSAPVLIFIYILLHLFATAHVAGVSKPSTDEARQISFRCIAFPMSFFFIFGPPCHLGQVGILH